MTSPTLTAIPTTVSITASTGNLISSKPFILNRNISVYSTITIPKGSIAPANSHLLSNHTFSPLSLLPGGITLIADSILALDFITKSEFPLGLNAILSNGTILSKGTKFPDGLSLTVPAMYGSLVATRQTFTVPNSMSIIQSIYYYQFFGDTYLQVDSSTGIKSCNSLSDYNIHLDSLRKRITELERYRR